MLINPEKIAEGAAKEKRKELLRENPFISDEKLFDAEYDAYEDALALSGGYDQEE